MCGGKHDKVLLQILCWIGLQCWKKFENRPTFAEVINDNIVGLFMTHSVISCRISGEKDYVMSTAFDYHNYITVSGHIECCVHSDMLAVTAKQLEPDNDFQSWYRPPQDDKLSITSVALHRYITMCLAWWSVKGLSKSQQLPALYQ